MATDPSTLAPAQGNFPPLAVPTVYADGVLNLAPTAQTVKFYLAVQMPDTTGANLYETRPVLQVAMPTSSFVETAVFFETALEQLVRDGFVSADTIELTRKGRART